MKFLVDECSDPQLVYRLRKDGHDVLYITEYGPGLDDREVLDLAIKNDRLLITEDKDFGELIFRFKKEVPGLILLRFDSKEKNDKINRLLKLINSRNSSLIGKYTVIDQHKYRIREF